MKNSEQNEYNDYCKTLKDFNAIPRTFEDWKKLKTRLEGNKMKKITKATFKSFIKKNQGNLFIQSVSDFDGMSDMVEHIPSKQRKFIPLQKDTVRDTDYQYGAERGRSREEIEASFFSNKNTLGYTGVWLVNHSRDSFSAFDDGEFEGMNVYNCCGEFTIAIKKRA